MIGLEGDPSPTGSGAQRPWASTVAAGAAFQRSPAVKCKWVAQTTRTPVLLALSPGRGSNDPSALRSRSPATIARRGADVQRRVCQNPRGSRHRGASPHNNTRQRLPQVSPSCYLAHATDARHVRILAECLAGPRGGLDRHASPCGIRGIRGAMPQLSLPRRPCCPPIHPARWRHQRQLLPPLAVA